MAVHKAKKLKKAANAQVNQPADQKSREDSTENPEFQRVVRHFLTTKPEHGKSIGKRRKPGE